MQSSHVTVANIGGASTSQTTSVDHDGSLTLAPSLPAANTSTGWTKTDSDTGIATLASGHGITTDMKVDVRWTGGARYGMTATVSTDDITVDGGAGDELPANGTAVTVAQQVEVTCAFDGDDLKGLLLFAAQAFRADVQGGDGTSHLPVSQAATVPYTWVYGSGVANPVTGDTVAKIMASTSYTSAAVTLNIGVALDATP